MAGALILCQACVTTRRPLADFEASGTKPKTTVQVFDPAGRPEGDPVTVGRDPVLVGRLRPSPWSAGQAGRQDAAGQAGGKAQAGAGAAETGGQEGAQDAVQAEDLYARFGANIIIHADGRVTKTYYVDAETGQVLDTLLTLATGEAHDPKKPPGRFEIGAKDVKGDSFLEALLGGNKIVIQRIPQFDQQKPIPLDPRNFTGVVPPTPEGFQVRNDLVLVTSKPDGVAAFEQAMDLFYRSVPQILIEARVLEFAWGDTLDLGVRPVDADTPTLQTLGRGSFIQSLVSNFPNTAVEASGATSKGILTIGGIHDNLELNAALELLQQKVQSDIVSHPKIAVRNGGVAAIDTTTQVPYPRAKIVGNNTQTDFTFAKVGVSMQIRPVVAPGEVVVLQIYAAVDAITGFAETEPIPIPEISTRRAVTSVHVPSGKTTVIGGLITKTSFANESQIPLLGDIPLLGYLFRSTFIQKGRSEVVFMITPRIIYGFEGADPLEEDFTGTGL